MPTNEAKPLRSSTLVKKIFTCLIYTDTYTYRHIYILTHIHIDICIYDRHIYTYIKSFGNKISRIATK